MTRSFDDIKPASDKQPEFAECTDGDDFRDLMFRSVATKDLSKLPLKVDLRASSKFPAACEQEGTSSGACAVVTYVAYLMQASWLKGMTFSRMFLSYNADAFESARGTNTSTRALLKAMRKHGMCLQRDWPDIPSHAGCHPPKFTYGQWGNIPVPARYYKVDQQRVALMQALAEGSPVLVTVNVYPGFLSEKTASYGRVADPDACTVGVGYHTMLLVGYDDVQELFLAQNSFGVGWGVGGSCYISYKYILDPNKCCDLWVIKLH